MGCRHPPAGGLQFTFCSTMHRNATVCILQPCQVSAWSFGHKTPLLCSFCPLQQGDLSPSGTGEGHALSWRVRLGGQAPASAAISGMLGAATQRSDEAHPAPSCNISRLQLGFNPLSVITRLQPSTNKIFYYFFPPKSHKLSFKLCIVKKGGSPSDCWPQPSLVFLLACGCQITAAAHQHRKGLLKLPSPLSLSSIYPCKTALLKLKKL